MKSRAFVGGVGALLRICGALVAVNAIVSLITGVVVGPLLLLWPWEGDPYRLFSISAIVLGLFMYRVGESFPEGKTWARVSVAVLTWAGLLWVVLWNGFFIVNDVRVLIAADDPQLAADARFSLGLSVLALMLELPLFAWLIVKLRIDERATLAM